MRRWLGLLAMLGLTSCGDSDVHRQYCAEDRDCTERYGYAGGVCIYDHVEATGQFCIMPDGDCPTGWRWSKWADQRLLDECVDPVFLSRDGGNG